MTARPILMSAPMIRSLLDGSKSQTRRVVKPQPSGDGDIEECEEIANEFFQWNAGEPRTSFLCPYGKPGDLLWVRETFARNGWKDGEKVFYRADAESQFMGEMRESNGNVTRYHTDHWERNGERKRGSDWKPSIHMPRWASRLTLQLTEVRVERLQEIGHADAMAEGIYHKIDMKPLVKLVGRPQEYASSFQTAANAAARDSYRVLWTEINGPGSWEANPWVWVLSFRIHQQNVDAVLKAGETA